MGVFDLQNKDGEQFSAIVGELVHRTWSSERASKEKDSSKGIVHMKCIFLLDLLLCNLLKSKGNWMEYINITKRDQ